MLSLVGDVGSFIDADLEFHLGISRLSPGVCRAVTANLGRTNDQSDARNSLSPCDSNIEDLRQLARRRLAKVVFDYLDGGAEGEVTLQENCRAFETTTFRPRNAVAIGNCDLRTRVLGHDLSFPGDACSHRLQPPACIPAAQWLLLAVRERLVLAISSPPFPVTGWRTSKAASTGPVWYQLYVVGGRDAAEAGIDRARRAGFCALVITIDTPVAGMRERDLRNGMTELLGSSIIAKIPYLPRILAHPAWLTSFLLDGGVPRLENIVIPGQGAMPLLDVTSALANAVVTWNDFRWIREAWPRPIVVKGVLTADDARRAVDEGAAAVVVSNHGGRQLDCVPPSLRALPEVVTAVNGQSRGADGRRECAPRRQRHCQSNLSWSTRSSDWACLRLWPCRSSGRKVSPERSRFCEMTWSVLSGCLGAPPLPD